jgi:hypothetical protein
MPTPESEMFLAKKPKVPPTFEGVDYDDNQALKAAQDAILREQWVRSMMARLVRDEMGKCYRREGVNHLEKCGHLRGMTPSFLISPPNSMYGEARAICKNYTCLSNLSISLWPKANRSITERYFELLKDAKVKGYLFAQQNYIDDAFKKQ